MWTTIMIARLTGSTLCVNHHLASFFAVDHRSVSTTNENSNLISKMRDLRARSSYALFLKDNYSEVSAKYPDLKLTDVSKKIAEIWKSLPDEKKQTYTKKSQDQKANYEQEKKRLSANDLQTIDADEKARKIQQRVKKSIQQLPTKRPRSAYIHYLATLDRGEADIGTFMKGASQGWSNMTAQDKQKFEDLHQEDKQKYVKELVAWAASNQQETKRVTRRSASTQTKDTPVKKTRAKSATGKRTVKKRATSAVSAAKTTKTKSPKKSSDKEASSSSSSSDDESKPKPKKSTKTDASTQS